MNMDNVKVIVVGSNHYNTLWVVRTLGGYGIKPSVVISSKSPKCYVLKSKYIRESWVVDDENGLLNILRSNCQSHSNKCFLFVTDDVLAETIDHYYEELKDNYVLPGCENKGERLGYWMDKWNMIQTAKDSGFCVPWSVKINLEDEDYPPVSEMPFPCILKPLKSSYGTKYDVRICHNETEFIATIDAMKGKCNHYIMQEFIEPEYELTIDGLRFREGNYTLFPGILRKDKTCTSTHNLGMVALAHLERNVDRYINSAVLCKFLSQIDYDGLCSFDLFVKDGKTYFLESNLRTDGDMFIYTTAGVNFPWIWMSLHLGKKTDDIEVGNRTTYGMIEISYMKYADWRHPWTIIRDWWQTDCYSIFSWKDMKPFFYKFIYAI